KFTKTIFVGDVAVGKTSLVNRFCHEVFDSNYKSTIGVDFEVERFDVLNTPFHLQIWDTAGQERFKCIATAYYRGAQAVVIVFDVTNTFSLQHVPVWLEETLENNKEKPLVFLVGTKRDLVSEPVYHMVEKQAIAMAKSLNVEYWTVSSKTGENVKGFFFRLAALCFNYSVLREMEVPQSSEVSKDFVSKYLDEILTRTEINPYFIQFVHVVSACISFTLYNSLAYICLFLLVQKCGPYK
ncbi:ras-related protein Rab-34-like, partial [Limulus polyphemus]|uniref:Ras-related protein Rab-34-like n=1 Tax=Limulus polyphemus TaxID=6850 RepID=A0ABM1T951_LIMPO